MVTLAEDASAHLFLRRELCTRRFSFGQGIEARGALHRIEVSLDRMANKPQVEHRQEDSEVKTGTLVRVYWPEIAFAP
jgi:hypothetical protein